MPHHVFPRATSTVVPDLSASSRRRSSPRRSPPTPSSRTSCSRTGTSRSTSTPTRPLPGGAALDVCYPSRNHSPSFVIQTFVADVTVSDAAGSTAQRHSVSAFDDLSVTLDVSPSLRAHLVRGCPYVTVTTTAGPVDVSVASVHAFLDVACCDDSGTKWRLRMNSGQTFLLYASAPIRLAQATTSQLSAPAFAGAIRVAYLPDASMEPVLDRYSRCFPTAGHAALNRPFCVDYAWRKDGPGELLMLAHPLHLRLLAEDDCAVRVLDDCRYRSIDGDMVGVVGDAWVLRTDPVSPTWHSTRGVSEDGVAEVVAALRADVAGLASTAVTTTSSYFYGRAIARAARLALIAEEVGCPDVIPAVQQYLKAAVTPWLDGSFQGNGFFYDAKWGGLVTLQGLKDPAPTSGSASTTTTTTTWATSSTPSRCWPRSTRAGAASTCRRPTPWWPTSRRCRGTRPAPALPGCGCSTSGSCTRGRGLTEFADGRNQESTSEAVNAYYSAALVGLSYGDAHLVRGGTSGKEGIYEDDFSGNNRVVGVLWANKRDSGLWFAPPEWKECRLGIQLLPVLPISEALFPDVAFVKDLVAWTLPALARDGVGEGWKGFVYALEGIYDKEAALTKTRALNGHDDGNSLTNLLWWLHSRGNVVGDGDAGFSRCCWYRQYCH
ncbi:unnamed protein product [Miscanthus lutarioriparius]|uniref:glucan endo-1,3-beta-D-glucosidase n=1 Tax=Miscanthus lutarioriparius TaxID=422564 RepID=A0A811NJY3_9POAL|nr:unnamed protein product [Miscanthus lutarioriparius]